ncbi:hypothetical protein [Nocardia sp. NPDC127526]|uniref:hypothetical protein n=1 Tax=Nocardia sp. NPDC127526 TaxID=3345393 RepID=UPI0036449096
MITYNAIVWTVSPEPVGRVSKSGEVWSPGPFQHTVWVLDATAPMGARVVNVKTRDELAYERPGAPTSSGRDTYRKAHFAPKMAAKNFRAVAAVDLFSVQEEVTCVG